MPDATTASRPGLRTTEFALAAAAIAVAAFAVWRNPGWVTSIAGVASPAIVSSAYTFARTKLKTFLSTCAAPPLKAIDMNLQAMLASLISRGLNSIPNQSDQTKADGQAAAIAVSAYVVDLAKDEALHELHSLAANGKTAELIAKIPALAALLKPAA